MSTSQLPTTSSTLQAVVSLHPEKPLYRSFLAQARPQQHPDEDQGHIVDANGTERGVQEAAQQAQAGHRAQDYAHSDSPQETEENEGEDEADGCKCYLSNIAHLFTLAFEE
jgi:hypothetical protein